MLPQFLNAGVQLVIRLELESFLLSILIPVVSLVCVPIIVIGIDIELSFDWCLLLTILLPGALLYGYIADVAHAAAEADLVERLGLVDGVLAALDNTDGAMLVHS